MLQSFKIRLLKEPEAPLKLYSDKDVKRLIKKTNLKKCSFTTYRNWVLIYYLVETGNRLRSIINIKVSDINFENHEVLIRDRPELCVNLKRE